MTAGRRNRDESTDNLFDSSQQSSDIAPIKLDQANPRTPGSEGSRVKRRLL